MEATFKAYGRLDGVVNNTGHAPKGELLEISDEDWHLGLDLMLLNVVNMARLVTPHLKDGSSIVNISPLPPSSPTLHSRSWRRCGRLSVLSPSSTQTATPRMESG